MEFCQTRKFVKILLIVILTQAILSKIKRKNSFDENMQSIHTAVKNGEKCINFKMKLEKYLNEYWVDGYCGCGSWSLHCGQPNNKMKICKDVIRENKLGVDDMLKCMHEKNLITGCGVRREICAANWTKKDKKSKLLLN